MLSKKAKYGLKAALFLARNGGNGAVPIADIARSENIPKKFLEFILVTLRNNGILYSQKGRRGGYLLKKSPTNITIGEIIRVLEGPIAPVPCVSVHAYHSCTSCRDDRMCEIKMVMKDVRDSIAGILDSTSLTDLIERAEGDPLSK